MKADYQWTCQLCGASNPPAQICAQCGLPAFVSAAEIELAKSLGVDAVTQKREKIALAKMEWNAKPFWKKMVVVVLMPILIIAFFFLAFLLAMIYSMAQMH